VGWHFVVVGPDLTITGPEQLVSPWVVLARSGQGPGPIRPTSSAYRSWATSCTKPRPQTWLQRAPSRRRRHSHRAAFARAWHHVRGMLRTTSTSTACSPKRTHMGW